MIDPPKLFVGIDVSQDFLDIALLPSGQCLRIANEQETILEELMVLLEQAERIVLEASGGYEKTVFKLLREKGLPAFLVNPRQVRDFARATGQLAKTDTLDAKVLAHYASLFSPKPAVTLLPEQEKLKALVERRRQLVDTLAQEKTRLKKTRESFIQESLQAHITQLKAWIKALEKEIKQLLKSPTFTQVVGVLEKVAGVGLVCMATLIADLPELGQLNRKEIAKLGGVAPLNADSGLFKGKRRIWGGRQEVRKALYMASLSARIHNEDIAPFYQRLTSANKPFKVVMAACMRKLLTILNARLREALLPA